MTAVTCPVVRMAWLGRVVIYGITPTHPLIVVVFVPGTLWEIPLGPTFRKTRFRISKLSPDMPISKAQGTMILPWAPHWRLRGEFLLPLGPHFRTHDDLVTTKGDLLWLFILHHCPARDSRIHTSHFCSDTFGCRMVVHFKESSVAQDAA